MTVTNCLLVISLCSMCGLMLIPVAYSLVSPLRSKFEEKSISQLQSSQVFNQAQPVNITVQPSVNFNLTSIPDNSAILPIELSSFNDTNFKDNDFMIISGSNNASQVSLISSIFHNSRKPKKNQSRIFFIPIRSLVPLSFNGTTVIFDSRSNSTSAMASSASGTNNGNVTFVLIEENTNSTVTASLVGANQASPSPAGPKKREEPPATTTAATTTTVAAATTTGATTTTVAATARPVTTAPAVAPSTAQPSTTLPPTTTTLASSIIHNFNDRIFFAPIPPVTPHESVTKPSAVSNVTTARPQLVIASIASSNSVPVGLLSSDQASSLLRQFALNSSEQLLNASSPECERQLDQTDACMRTVLLVNGNTKSPTTFDELDAIYCKNLTGLLRCLGGYSKCLHRVPRIIYNFVYLHIKRTLEQVCKNAAFRSDIIFHSRCFVEQKELSVVKRIVDQGTLTALYVLKFIPTNKIVGWSCCGYQKMFHDGITQINEVCKQKTANNTGEFAMGFLQSAAADLIDIGCRKYSSVELCQENLPEAMATFAQLTSGSVPEQRYSPVIPLIEITRRLASNID